MTPRLRGSRRLVPIAVMAVLLLVPSPVAAHAELVRAIPADGETVTEPVTVVSGRYSQDLADGSRLEIKDPSGATVATGDIDPEDDRRMVARPDAPLVDGTFTVESTAISAEDGDIERVTWTFRVEAAATSSPSATASESPSIAASSAPPTTAPSETPTSGPAPTTPASDTGDVLLPIIAALALVAIGAGLLLGRGRSRPG